MKKKRKKELYLNLNEREKYPLIQTTERKMNEWKKTRKEEKNDKIKFTQEWKPKFSALTEE